MYLEEIGRPIDELGLIIAAITIHKHIAVMLRGFKWWTTREDDNWEKCDVFFAYTGKMKFVHIQRISNDWLNKTADKVGLCNESSVLKKAIKRKQASDCCKNLSPAKRRRGRPRKQNDEPKPIRKLKPRESKTKGKKLLKVVLCSRRSPKKNKSPKKKVSPKKSVSPTNKIPKGRGKKKADADNVKRKLKMDYELECPPKKPRQDEVCQQMEDVETRKDVIEDNMNENNESNVNDMDVEGNGILVDGNDKVNESGMVEGGGTKVTGDGESVAGDGGTVGGGGGTLTGDGDSVAGDGGTVGGGGGTLTGDGESVAGDGGTVGGGGGTLTGDGESVAGDGGTVEGGGGTLTGDGESVAGDGGTVGGGGGTLTGDGESVAGDGGTVEGGWRDTYRRW